MKIEKYKRKRIFANALNVVHCKRWRSSTRTKLQHCFFVSFIITLNKNNLKYNKMNALLL